MTAIASIGTVTRAGTGPTTHTGSTVFISDSRFATGAGGSGFPADRQLQGLIKRETIKGGPSIRTASDPGGEGIVWFEGERKGGAPDSMDDLHGVEIIGQPAKLLEVGDIFGQTFTLTDPHVYADGTVAPGSVVKWDTFRIGITPTPLPWATAAVTTFSNHGPAILFPDAALARVTWPAFDPAGDFTIFFFFLPSLEDREAASVATQTLFDNGDWTIQIIDSRLQATIAHATTPAVVLAPVFVRPEAFLAGRITYDASELELELFLFGDSQGTDVGVGALTASALAWVFGANQAETAEFFHGGETSIWMFDTLVQAETADEYELSGLSYNEPDLVVAFDGQTFSTTATLDAAAAVDLSGGLVGFPATAHNILIGQEVTMVGTTGYDVSVDLLPAHPDTTVNQIVIAVAFVSETFGGTEQALVRFALLVDQAIVNDPPLNATIKGARPATSFGGGISAGGAAEATLAGTVHPRASGPVLHVLGRQVDSNDWVQLHGDPHRGAGFKTLHQGGVETVITETLSYLAFYAAAVASAEAVVEPVLGLSRIDTRVEGSIAADVCGESPWIRGLKFNGENSQVNFGTTDNVIFTDSFTIITAISYLPTTASSVEIFTNTTGGSAGILLADEIDVSDLAFRLISFRALDGLSVIVDLEYQYPVHAVAHEIAVTVARSGAGPVFTWDAALYIDGGLQDSSSLGGNSVTSVSDLFLGRNVAGTTFWRGRLSKLCIL